LEERVELTCRLTSGHRALSPDGNPSFGTILKITKALGLKLTLKAA
jgi:DNA-binding phage protein